jgi:hypothetical protein
MRREEIQVGLQLRIIRQRWDVPIGTLAKVQHVGQAGVPPLWCFTCEWLFTDGRPSPRGSWSLNLFEEDLPDFEPYAGQFSVELPQKNRKSQLMPTARYRDQLCLPFMDHEIIPGESNTNYHLRSNLFCDLGGGQDENG